MVASSESSLWVIVYTNLAVLLLWGYGKSGGGGRGCQMLLWALGDHLQLNLANGV